MRPAVFFLLLLSACDVRNFRTYELTWTCSSSEGCERTDQVVLIDRAEIVNGDELVTFLSSRDVTFREVAQMVPSDTLPADCFWLHDVTFFVLELEPSRFCRTKGEFELALSIPNRNSAAASEWLVSGREIDP